MGESERWHGGGRGKDNFGKVGDAGTKGREEDEVFWGSV
jgi:hypothetical protein